MDSLNLLKQEINQTFESEHDFAKWKLIVVAGLGGAALGLGKGEHAQMWLLLLIPFTCAYIDLHLSQYQSRILVLAQFIRGYLPAEPGENSDTTLQQYEKYCQDLRTGKESIFDLGQRAHILASLGLSFAAPVVAIFALWPPPVLKSVGFGHRFVEAALAFFHWLPTTKHLIGAGLWLVGFAAILVVWLSHSRRLGKLAKRVFPAPTRRLASMIQPLYSPREIDEIQSFLQHMGTLAFTPLPNGLFPAAAAGTDKDYTGYSNVWVRDNVHIAHAHYVVGKTDVAVKNLRALMEYFAKHQQRFQAIISGSANSADPMSRPHIRFNGATLEEINQKWAHAQNDALGYFLWMFCRLADDAVLTPAANEWRTLDLFPQYFQKIRYWQDEDSGHWEETRKISASSIGAVVAGLQEFEKLLGNTSLARPADALISSATLVKSLIDEGRRALSSILPRECVQSDPAKYREYDAALLFLIYPLQVIEPAMADQIVENARRHLQGRYGIRRYPGDSYWAPDFKERLATVKRTVDFSDNMAARDRLLPSIGQEAQWTIFDPIISCIYAVRFAADRRSESLICQSEYLNRALAQITSESAAGAPPFRCPELYYLERGQYVPNDHVPLLWTQANLMLALWFMKQHSK